MWGTQVGVPLCPGLSNNMIVVCRPLGVAFPVVSNIDVGRCVADDSLIAHAHPKGMRAWWGLHKL